MACSRGAASPDAHTQRRLFAASAGYCQNPKCSNELFVDAAGKSIHIAEMAHVFAANDGGPRTKLDLSKEERGAFENLVMLCANCHTMVDKVPDAFPDKMMLNWKREHANKLQGLFGAVKFSDRADARQVMEPLLAENYAIFVQYGPHIDAARNPESGAAEQWKRKMLTRILPNSRRMLAILDANRLLLNGNEKATLELFRQHIDDLEAFHIEGNREDASRFPGELPKIMEDWRMSNKVSQWVADKLGANEELEVVDHTPEDFLIVRSKGAYTFLVAVLGVRSVIELPDVEPLFVGATKPQFIVNVPSKTLWSGAAINCIHAASAAFGTLGDISRAADTEDAGSYRDRNMGFFINSMTQHSNVSNVSYVYETVFEAERKSGANLTVAVIDAYNMSAEDVRNANTRFGHFDVVVKSSSYGSITAQAAAAAESMGALALTYGELMRRLAK